MVQVFNNDKNVYLLGAGFSKEAGLPLQDDFLLTAKEVYFKDQTKYSHFNSVFEYQDGLTKMKKYLNSPLLNLEYLFNLMEMDLFYSNNVSVQSIKNNFIGLICDVLMEKTPHPYRNNREGKFLTNRSAYQYYLNFLNLFTYEKNNKTLLFDDSVISFNYDLVLESAACMFNYDYNNNSSRENSDPIKFNEGFEKNNIDVLSIKGFFKKISPDTYFPEVQLFSATNSIKLLKLHGSINWITVSDDKMFIVPPTWNKSDPEVKFLWNKAYEELKTAKRIIVIGYSFPETDIYVKSLLSLAINENKILQNIYFINPDSNIAKKASLSLIDKNFESYCEYKSWKFSYLMDSEEGKKFLREKLNRG